MNPAAKLLNLLGEANDRSAPQQGGRRGKRSSGTPAKPAIKVLQMSHVWISDRIRKDFFRYAGRILSGNGVNYSRHVFLVTPIQASDHIKSITKIMEEGLVSNPSAAQKYAKEHAVHDVGREFGEADLAVAEQEYAMTGKPAKSKNRPKNKP